MCSVVPGPGSSQSTERRLAAAGVKPEWGRMLMELDLLQKIKIEQGGKHFIARTPVTGDVGRVFQAVGIALPPTMRRSCRSRRLIAPPTST
jgi:hypothetical protein